MRITGHLDPEYDHSEEGKESFPLAKDPEAESVYEMYYEFEEPVAKLAGHRILALNRGREGEVPDREGGGAGGGYPPLPGETGDPYGQSIYTTPLHERQTAADSYQRLIAPAIEREIRNELTEKAEDGAIEVFGKNLHQLLMQPPITGKGSPGMGPGVPYRV